MTTPIPTSYPISTLNKTPSSASSSSSSSSSTGSNALDKDTFLKLLVAQLRYQDPLKPSDPQAFLAQTAQFTQVEKLEEISKQNTDAIRGQGLSTASALMGRSVTFQNADGTYDSGTVTGASLDTDGVHLKLGTKTADLSAVTEIGNPVTAP